MTTNKIDVVESACEEYSQEVLGFSNVTDSGMSTPQNDPIVSVTSPTLTPFGDSDFLLFEEADAFLGLEDDPDSLKINPFYYNPEGDILVLEAILNSEPSPPPPNQEQNMPSFKEELKAYEAQTIKSSVDEPPEVELKDLPHHLEYAFLEGDNKLPVIIAKELGDDEKSALLKDAKERLLRWVLLLQEFDFKVLDTKGAENLAADHLSRLENPYENVLDPKEINEKFLLETLSMVTFRGDSSASWFADFANYHAALADLGASINLMPLSVWEELSLPKLTPTCMTLELADRSVSKPIGVAKDVSVKVGMFHFPTEFVVVDFEPDPRVPLILTRCFLKTGRALIDVNNGELTLRIGNEAITYNYLDQTSRYSANYNQMTANKIEVICEEYSQEVFGFSNTTASGNPTPYDDPIVSITSPTLTSFGDSDFLLFEEADAFLGLEDDPNSLEFNPFYYDPEGDILLLETILNSGFTVVENKENKLIPTRLVTGWRVCIDYRKLNEATRKDHFPLPFMDQMIERLTGNEYYCFLDGFSRYFQIAIDPRDQEKITFTCPNGTFACRRMPFGLCNAPGTFQRCMLAIFHDLVEKTMEVFMDDFSVFGNSFENCLSHLDKMLQWCEDTNLSLNWEKIHFMVKEGIVLGQNISKNEIEVDKAKVDVIAKLPHPTTVKGAVLGQRHEKHFKPIHYASKTMNDAESNYTTTEKEMLAVVYAFEKFRSYLIMNKSIVHTDHSAFKYLFAKKDAKARLLRWVLLLQEFDFKVFDTKGAENLAADHLSRLENPYENMLDLKEINENFRLETLSMVTFHGDSSAPWFVDFVNYYAGNFIVK
nr:retrovirus-related Pol polyprotein [Tanacetum cinerariifolium]